MEVNCKSGWFWQDIDVSILTVANMKLKVLFWGIVVGLWAQFANAQPYKPLLDDFNEWHFTTCYSGCNTSAYYTDGDTVVNGLSYKILDAYHYISRTVLLREDVANREVFLVRILPNKIQSVLLYDFKKTEGDTMELFNPMAPFVQNPGYFLLDSIRFKPLEDGNSYRHFYWSPTAGNALPDSYPVWVEGVGSLSLINAPGGHPDFNGVGQLSCFFKNGTAFYASMDSITSCIPDHFLEISGLSLDQEEVSLYPNPSSGMIYWNANEIKSVVVFDLSGKELFKTDVDFQEKQLSLEKLSNGVYWIDFRLNNGSRQQKQVVLLKD